MKEDPIFTRSAVVWICMAMCGSLTSVSAADTQAVPQQAESAKDGFLRLCATKEYEFTPKLRKAFLANAVFRLLPEEERRTHGVKLLESGLALNPHSFLLVDAAQNTAATPQEVEPPPNAPATAERFHSS